MGGIEEVEAACQGKAAPEVCKVAAGDTRCYGRSAAMAGSVRLWAAMLREEEAGAVALGQPNSSLLTARAVGWWAELGC
uniref:Uncharacterized protein n=1 Tax=Oryza nivara TaxID=4536 RepID=A0A0E0H0M7_ORYNI